jgi:hypothetical protein
MVCGAPRNPRRPGQRDEGRVAASPPIRTPDLRLRVFVSSTLAELAEERTAVREVIERLQLTPVLFELGARPHPPRALYRAYLQQSHVFVGCTGSATAGWPRARRCPDSRTSTPSRPGCRGCCT